MVIENWRILGVLQYFSIAGLCVALVAQFVPELSWGKTTTRSESLTDG